MYISKNTEFWLIRALVIVAVVAIALGFVLYLPSNDTSQKPSENKTKNDATISKSVSKFYAEFRQSSTDPIKEQFGEDTLLLDDNGAKSLGNAIEHVSKQDFEPSDNWQGNFKERAFAAQSTLMQEATKHIAKEGFNLVWDLNQDFIIRNRYKSTNTLPGLLEEIAGAIDSNFNQPIAVYYCFKKRAMVITVRESTYLKENCQKTSSGFQSY